MPRHARVVLPEVPHHVTQRGNHGDPVFYDDGDRLSYLEDLLTYAEKNQLEIASYCLMSNHSHLLVIPSRIDSIASTLKPVHMRHSQRLNRRFMRNGLNWQGRFFSAPMDEQHTWNTFQYIYQNPVEAGLVEKGHLYTWSSGRAHLHNGSSKYLNARKKWLDIGHQAVQEVERTTNFDKKSEFAIIQRNTDMNLPLGSDDFISRLEKKFGRLLRYRPRGGQARSRKIDEG